MIQKSECVISHLPRITSSVALTWSPVVYLALPYSGDQNQTAASLGGPSGPISPSWDADIGFEERVVVFVSWED